MEVNRLIAALERNGHLCERDRDEKVVAWIQERGGLVIKVDGKPMFPREAERLLPWVDRYSN